MESTITLGKNAKDFTGQKFGRLTAIRPVGRDKKSRIIWLFSCSCGNQLQVLGSRANTGKVQSCGCWQKELLKTRNLKHGHTANGKQSPEHRAWSSMYERCYRKNQDSYELTRVGSSVLSQVAIRSARETSIPCLLAALVIILTTLLLLGTVARDMVVVV